jgi:hypothetical protein
MTAGVPGHGMEGALLDSIFFTLVIVAMGFPGLILLAWPDVASQLERAARAEKTGERSLESRGAGPYIGVNEGIESL